MLVYVICIFYHARGCVDGKTKKENPITYKPQNKTGMAQDEKW